jgi:hypothetical protein
MKFFLSSLNKNNESIKIFSNKIFIYKSNINNNNNITKYIFFYYQQKKKFCEKNNNNNNNNNKENKDNKNYINFQDFIKSQSTKKSKIFTEQENHEEKNYNNNDNIKENSKDNNDTYNNYNFTGKSFTKKQINQQKNFLSQRKKLVLNIKTELDYFKLDENFKLENLRKKYLFFAKLYHPDIVNSDKKSGENFNLLKNNYEKLKVYCEMRDKLGEIEKNIEEDGTIILETYEMNWSNVITQPEKQEIIKELCKFFYKIFFN